MGGRPPSPLCHPGLPQGQVALAQRQGKLRGPEEEGRTGVSSTLTQEYSLLASAFFTLFPLGTQSLAQDQVTKNNGNTIGGKNLIFFWEGNQVVLVGKSKLDSSGCVSV